MSEQLTRDLLTWGIHGDLTLRSEQERAIVDLLREVAKLTFLTGEHNCRFMPNRVRITQEVMAGDKAYPFVNPSEDRQRRMEALMKEDETVRRHVEKAERRQIERLAEVVIVSFYSSDLLNNSNPPAALQLELGFCTQPSKSTRTISPSVHPSPQSTSQANSGQGPPLETLVQSF